VRRSDQRRAAVVALYQAEVTERPLAELIRRREGDFTRELAEGVEANRPELDELIERYAVGWTLDRIAPLEKAILRVSLFELLHRSDVPTEVSIDEAVEAAKELCAEGAPAFLNGILGAVARDRVATG